MSMEEICGFGYGGHSASVEVDGDVLTIRIDGHRAIQMERLQAMVLAKAIGDWAKHD